MQPFAIPSHPAGRATGPPASHVPSHPDPRVPPSPFDSAPLRSGSRPVEGSEPVEDRVSPSSPAPARTCMPPAGPRPPQSCPSRCLPASNCRTEERKAGSRPKAVGRPILCLPSAYCSLPADLSNWQLPHVRYLLANAVPPLSPPLEMRLRHRRRGSSLVRPAAPCHFVLPRQPAWQRASSSHPRPSADPVFGRRSEHETSVLSTPVPALCRPACPAPPRRRVTVKRHLPAFNRLRPDRSS
jgi:hypothetical protein